MSDFDHEILDALEGSSKFDPAREEVLRLQVGSEFNRRKKRLKIWYWAWHVVLLVILMPAIRPAMGILPGSPLYSNDPRLKDPVFLAQQVAAETRATTQATAIILIVTAGLVVIKLWYWIVHSRMEIVREIKRLELRTIYMQRPGDLREAGH